MIATKDVTMKSLLKAAKGGDPVAVLASLDRLREAGYELAADLVAKRYGALGAAAQAKQIAVHLAALDLHEALERVE
jgi:hypothetical protein